MEQISAGVARFGSWVRRSVSSKRSVAVIFSSVTTVRGKATCVLEYPDLELRFRSGDIVTIDLSDWADVVVEVAARPLVSFALFEAGGTVRATIRTSDLGSALLVVDGPGLVGQLEEGGFAVVEWADVGRSRWAPKVIGPSV